MNRAVFLDRDGVINELVYYEEHGIVDSPFTVEQFKLLGGVGLAIRELNEAGYKVILVSNQPGIAKGHMSPETFDRIRDRMKKELAKQGAFLDGEYYCFHHPEANLRRLRAKCECRKPRPGLLRQAAQEMGVDLSRSWMIGDGLTDIQAGNLAGTGTVLIGRMKCELCKRMDENDARPDVICSSLLEAARLIRDEAYVTPGGG